MTIGLDAIEQTDHRINRLVADLFFHPTTVAHGAEHGVANPLVLYSGRVTAMGTITEEVALATMGFMAPDLVATVFAEIQQVDDPLQLAALFADAMAACARERWPAGPCATIADVGRQVAEAAPTLGLPLFAAWRAIPAPADPVGAAAITAMALRELRGDIHIQQVAAAGLTPVEAEMVSRGELGAQMHGWPEPWPDPEPLRAAMAEVDAATNRRCAAAYGRVPEADVERFVEAVAELATAVDTP